jgi:hypothetical protein
MTGVKANTIKLLLRKKINEWIESIEVPELKQEMAHNVIVTGGSIASFLLGEKPNDYDFYLRTKNATLKAAVYYAIQFNRVNALKTSGARPYKVKVDVKTITNIKGIDEERIIFHMQSAGIASETQAAYAYFETQDDHVTGQFMDSLTEYSQQQLEDHPTETVEGLNEELKKDKEKKPYRPVFLTDNAVSLANRVQLITRFYGEPEEIHKNFDFVHAMAWYDYKKDHLELPADTMQALLTKTLIYKGSLYPIASLFRIRKFLNRGFRISAGQMLKIVWQIHGLKLDDPNILKEQLIGVDMAYMHQLIAELQNIKAHEKVDGTYVAALIDKIFDE